MSLEIDQVPTMLRVRRVPEMIEPDAKQGSYRSKGGDVPTQLVVVLVRFRHHDHRVPAAEGTDALLERMISRRTLFQVRRNRIEVGGVERERNIRARSSRLVDQPLEQIVSSLGTFAVENRFERIQP